MKTKTKKTKSEKEPPVKLWGLLKGKEEISGKTTEQLWEEIDEGWDEM